MRNLEDYLPRKPRKTSPPKISESPIFSPDTADALEKAESLVREARKTILEASYDIDSSPECDKSTRNGAEDEEALYIRDVVAVRFHEANESARIFTRPSTRPLAERICRTRPRRARRGIRSEDTATSKPRSVRLASRDLRRDHQGIPEDQRRRTPAKSLPPRRAIDDDEIPTRIVRDAFPGPRGIDGRNAANSFGVQRGPRVDIRNELTTTSVEKVVISPDTSLPVRRNVRTYEFRHESCVEKIVGAAVTDSREKIVDSVATDPREKIVGSAATDPREKIVGSAATDPREKIVGSVATDPREKIVDSAATDPRKKSPSSSEAAPTLGDDVATRDSPGTPEKSRDTIRKCCGFVATATAASAASQQQPQGSRSDLAKNKSGRSFPAERLEGHAERVSRQNENVEENIDDKENERNSGNADNRDVCFMDFLRCSGKFGKDENSQRKVFRRIETNERIDIIDRAVDRFLDEFGRQERIGQVRENVVFIPEKEADGNFVVDDILKEAENNTNEEFGRGEYFEENWEEMNLQAPNFGHLEKALRKFDCTIDEVLRGTRGLDVIISEYNSAKEIAPRAEPRNRDCNARLFYSAPTEDISVELESRSIDNPEKKARDNRRDQCAGVQDTNEAREELIGSREYGNSAARYYRGRGIAKKLPTTTGESSGRYDNHPRFSTPLNNDLKIMERPGESKADRKSDEFARFLVGIQRPGGRPEASADFSRFDDHRHDVGKIVLNRNEFASAATWRNDLEARKKNVLKNDNKCNFSSPLKGDGLSGSENCPIGERAEFSELGHSRTKSPTRDSAISRGTDRSDGISVGTKLIDELSAKKDSKVGSEPAAERESRSKRSTTEQDASVCQLETVGGKNIESASIRTLTMKNNSVPTAGKAEKSATKLSAAADNFADAAKRQNHENEHLGATETRGKNRVSESSGSSMKDRTSFDISTVYSEDFEEPAAASDDKSKAHEASGSSETAAELKSISKRQETATRTDDNKNQHSKIASSLQSSKMEKLQESKTEAEDNKKQDSKIVSSLQSSGMEKLQESKKEAQCLVKSVSMSAGELTGKTEECKKDDSGGSPEVELVAEEKGTVECNSEIKEADKIQEEEEKSRGDEDTVATSSASAKVSGTSSIVGASRLEVNNKNSGSHSEHRVSTKISSRSGGDIPGQYEETDFSAAGRMIQAPLGTSVEFAKFESSVAFHSTPKRSDSHESPETDEKKSRPSPFATPSEGMKISRVNGPNEVNACESRATDPKEITDSMTIDSSPRRQIENSRCASREFLPRARDPIPDDDHADATTAAAAVATDTCSENYSEGELYLPSSCSYSLGEIRISERGFGGTVIQSSGRNADGMRIYFGKRASSNAIVEQSNSPAQSPGEVQDTDVESISSSSGSATSEGEHRMVRRYYTLQLRPADT